MNTSSYNPNRQSAPNASHRSWRVLAASCFLAGLSALQAQTITLNKSLAAGTPNPIPAGSNFIYQIEYSFASTSGDFYNAIIRDVLPSGLVYAGTVMTTPHVATYTAPSSGNAGTVTFTMVEPLSAGSSGTLTILARYAYGTTTNGLTRTNFVTSTANLGSESGSVINSTSGPVVTVASAACVWVADITSPTTVALDQALGVRVRLMRPTPNLTNYSVLAGSTLAATLPVGVLPTDVLDSTGGVVTGTGLSGDPVVVTWTTTGTINASGSDGGESFGRDMVIRFRSAAFSVGNTPSISETATLNLAAGGGTCVKTDTVTTTISAATTTGTMTKNASVSNANADGSSAFQWGIHANNTGRTDLDNFVLADDMPVNFALQRIYLPNGISYAPTTNFITVRYRRSDTGTTLYTWPGSPFPVFRTNLVPDLGLPAGVYVSRVEFDLGTVPVGFGTGSGTTSNNRFRLEGVLLPIGWNSPPTILVTGDSVCNTNVLTATSSQPGTVNVTNYVCVTAAVPTVRPASTKSIVESPTPAAGGLIRWQVETSTGTGSPLLSPMAMDLLPAEVEYVPGTFDWRTDSTFNSSGASNATASLVVMPNYSGSGRTLLRWQYTNSFPASSRATVRFQTRVKSGTAMGTSITNRSYVYADPTRQNGSVVLYSSPVTDTNDLNGNGVYTDLIGQSVASNATVSASAALESRKLVRGALDTEYTRYPDFGFTVPGGADDYQLSVTNVGSVAVTNIVLLDILPSVGDVGVLDPQPRLSEWTPQLTGPINVTVNGAEVPGTVVEYSTAANPCRPDWIAAVGCTAPGWSVSLPSPITSTRAFQVTFPATYSLAAGASMTINIPMIAPLTMRPGSISWNSFAYRATPTSTGLGELKSEPIKVGVSAIPPYSIGDYVWVDENSDGYQDAGEPGIPNVQVFFFSTNGTLIASNRTDATGHYLFSGLLQEAGYVRVDETTIPTGMTQTPPSTLTNSNFGNQDQTTGANDYGYFVRVLTGIPNLTADFGYNYNPASDVLNPTGSPAGSIGDRVWLDFNGNGRQDPDELGVRGATVQIFTAGNDGLFGTGDDVAGATRTTDANGNYIFDGLTPGAYVVRVVSDVGANYPILGASYSQTGDPDAFGTISTGDNATTTPLVLSPGDVFLNADFGYKPGASVTLGTIGDLVWLDVDASGTATPNGANETGIEGVSLSLIRDVNGNGVWDSGEPIIATTTTDTNGQYLFRGVPLSDDGDSTTDDADYLVWVNDTADRLAGKTQTYGNLGASTPLGRAVLAPAPGSPQNLLTVDFSFKPTSQQSAPAATTAVLGDRVWFDANRNGVLDAGESGIPGLLMELLHTTSDHVEGLAVTDPSGYYYFAGLETNGQYSVRVAGANFVDGGMLMGMVNTFEADGGTNGWSSVNFAISDGPNDPDATRNFINLGQDFGYGPPPGTSGSIGNQIWVDANADGIRTPNGADGNSGTDDDEPAIAGVTVDLYRDLDLDGRVDPGEPLIAATTTDASGLYLFTGLPLTDGLYDRQIYVTDPDAAYVVNVSDRAGMLPGWWHSLGQQSQLTNDTSKIDPFAVTLTNTAPSVLTADFGYYVEPAAVGNFVWLDANGNGLQDTGEAGLDGILMQCVITYPDGTITTLKTVTGDDPATPATELGWYSFGNLLQDEHYNGDGVAPEPAFEISVLTTTGTGLLTGLEVTRLNQGNNPKINAKDPAGTAAAPVKGVTDMQPFSSPDSQPLPASYDFGYVRPLAIGNLIWFDANNNGTFDTGETVVPGVHVELLNATNGSVLRSTYTDDNGYYLFDGLFPGDYQVQVTADNWTGLSERGGTKPLAACNSSSGNASAAETSGTGAVNGKDHGVDNSFPATNGITSLTVTLAVGNQPLSDMDAGATGAGGHGENGDAYDNLALDFGFYRLSVGNLVFSDANKDGLFNIGDAGLNGVTVELYQAGNRMAVTTTTGGGAYLFAGDTDGSGVLTGNPLTPGTNTYTIQLPASQLALSGLYSTKDTVGTPSPNGGVDNDDNVVGTSATTALLNTPAFTLAAGAGAPLGTIVTGTNGLTYQPTIDLGLADSPPSAAIGNLVFADGNNNGSYEPGLGETGINGVEVVLWSQGTGPGGSDEPAMTNATANIEGVDGSYLFIVSPGTYFVQIPVPPASAPLSSTVTPTGNDKDNGLQPGGSGASTAAVPVTLTTGQTNLAQDFGFVPSSSFLGKIGDRTWLDLNANGVQNPNEPGLGGVTVRLYQIIDGASRSSGTNSTSASGLYLFTNLPPASYFVEFLRPTGYTNSPTGGTNNAALDSDADPVTGRTVTFALGLGATDLTWDAGFISLNPTAAAFGWLGAWADHGNVWVTWQTFTEAGLLGFDVWRSAAGSPETLVTLAPVEADGQSSGHQYVIPDDTAKLPGNYTYRLSGYLDDSRTPTLARVTVSLSADATAATIRLLTVESEPGGLRVRWSGGMPPYTLEHSDSLAPGTVWQTVGPAQAGDTEAIVPITQEAGFFRVNGCSQ